MYLVCYPGLLSSTLANGPCVPEQNTCSDEWCVPPACSIPDTDCSGFGVHFPLPVFLLSVTESAEMSQYDCRHVHLLKCLVLAACTVKL